MKYNFPMKITTIEQPDVLRHYSFERTLPNGDKVIEDVHEPIRGPRLEGYCVAVPPGSYGTAIFTIPVVTCLCGAIEAIEIKPNDKRGFVCRSCGGLFDVNHAGQVTRSPLNDMVVTVIETGSRSC